MEYAMSGVTAFPAKKRRRITGEERQRLGERLKAGYEEGKSINQLAAETGRSYTSTHRMLREFGVTLRGRGGKNRVKPAVCGTSRVAA
jgi:predicted transcriptional regulator